MSWTKVLVVIAIVLAPAMMMLLAGGGFSRGAVILWLFLMICLAAAWALLAARRGRPAEPPRPEPRMLSDEEQPAAVREVMSVRAATDDGGVRIFRGRLRESAAAAYEKLKRSFWDRDVPLLQEDEHRDAAIVLVPRAEQATAEQPIRPWVHWLLFGLTIVTTTIAGAAHQGVNLFREPQRFTAGLPYSLGLLSILGIHELGHYFMARRRGIRVTPPYFIPVPFGLGTFGAFIQVRSPAENRRALFDMAVAGPLAGLVVAIPALMMGLKSSAIVADDGSSPYGVIGGGAASVESSLLFALLSKVSLGDALQAGDVLRLSPLAFAGWLGLFVTALNLLPIGQLDGGHMAQAMFGRRVGRWISSIAMWTLLLLAIFVWPALMMWALLVYFLAGSSALPLNDLTPLSPARRLIGYATFAVLALILLPLPNFP